MQQQPGVPGGPWGPAAAAQAMTPGRRRSIAPWWVSLILLFVGSILGLVWFFVGGLPMTDHGAYDGVNVPGSARLELPAGEIWISFEENGLHGEDDSADMPNDLVVTVESASGVPVTVERLSGNLFSVRTNDTGHVPYGRIKIATAGAYRVDVSGSRTTAVEARVLFGEPPWNPFGAPIVGALVIFVPFLVIALILLLPLPRTAPAPVMVRF